jgi:hypothetical protein
MHDWETADPDDPKSFERVIRHAGKTLLVMEPWCRPRPPTRVWCLFECYTTLKLPGGALTVALGREQQREMQMRLVGGVFDDILRVVRQIDARKAEASVPVDQDRIFQGCQKGSTV